MVAQRTPYYVGDEECLNEEIEYTLAKLFDA